MPANNISDETDKVCTELSVVRVAMQCSIRKVITRLQHEQSCAAGISYSASHEQHESNIVELEHTLRTTLATMHELAGMIEYTLAENE